MERAKLADSGGLALQASVHAMSPPTSPQAMAKAAVSICCFTGYSWIGGAAPGYRMSSVTSMMAYV